jgi:DNA polymerase III alpha subunit (gram-positive type)
VVKTAARWGHKAIAITDHGNLQSFPVAMLTADGLKKDGKEIKVLYGVEAYYVDDTFRASYKGEDIGFSDECIVFDIETTGLSAVSCKITEIGAVRIKGGEVLERFNMLVNPEQKPSEESAQQNLRQKQSRIKGDGFPHCCYDDCNRHRRNQTQKYGDERIIQPFFRRFGKFSIL